MKNRVALARRQGKTSIRPSPNCYAGVCISDRADRIIRPVECSTGRRLKKDLELSSFLGVESDLLVAFGNELDKGKIRLGS